jgi:hypothetical protein
MFQGKVLEEMGINFRFSNFDSENRGFFYIMWGNYSTTRQAAADSVEWCLRIA